MATIPATISRGSKNRFVSTETFNDAAWSQSGTGTRALDDTEPNPIGDPLATRSPHLLVDTTSVGVYQIFQTLLGSDPYLDGNSLVTFSVYLKPKTSTDTKILITIPSGTKRVKLVIDWTTETISKQVDGSLDYTNVDIRKLTGVGAGWYRCSATLKYDGTGNDIRGLINPSDDGTDTPTDSVWAWGAQLEISGRATSYQDIIGTTDPNIADFPTIASWIAATSVLVGGAVYEGQLRDEEYKIASGTLVFNAVGDPADADTHRKLTYATNSYDPVTNTGPRIISTFAVNNNNNAIRILFEDYVHIDGIGFLSDFQPRQNSGENRFIQIVRCGNCIISNCYFSSQVGNKQNLTLLTTAIHINGNSGNPAIGNKVFNCIFTGTSTTSQQKGLTTAIRWGSFALTSAAYNCAAYHCAGFAFQNDGQLDPLDSPTIVNCISVGSQRDYFNSYIVFRNNISSSPDATLIIEVSELGEQNPNPADPNSIIGITGSSLFAAPDQQDFRLASGSTAIDAGSSSVPGAGGVGADDLDVALEFTNALGSTADFAGNVRTGIWDIGPYQGPTLPISTPFVTQNKTVGRDKSRDYNSVYQFVKDLPRSLYYSNEKWVATCYEDEIDDIGETIEINNFDHIVSQTNNIEIKANNNVNPAFGTGHKIELNLDVDLVGRHRAVFWITANYTKISGIQISQAATSLTTKNARTIELFADHCLFDALYLLFSGTYSRNIGTILEVETSNFQITNSIFRGSDTVETGASIGFNSTPDSTGIRVYHCLAYRLKGGTTPGTQPAVGFRIQSALQNVRLSGCISIETAGVGGNGVIDYLLVGSTADGVLDHCISSDTTSGGSGSHENISASTIFSNPTQDDFRLLPGTVAQNGGANLAEEFSTDILGESRISPFEIGPYEGVVFPQHLSTPRPQDHHRFVSLWEILRTDGVAHFICTSNTNVTHKGQIYKPVSSASTSARRMESALKESNVEIAGAIVSSEITSEALASGVFTGARIVERVVDWRYPWTEPYKVRKYRVAHVEFDQDSWRVELVGPTIILNQKVGETVGVNCPYQLGDDDCQFLISTVSETNRSVFGIVDIRRKFTCRDMSNFRVTDYFGKGIISWINGNNAGISMEVKNYTTTGSSCTITLSKKAPFDIQALDTFNMKPGCRKRYLEDCRDKYDHALFFGGRPFMPGTDRALQTPTR